MPGLDIGAYREDFDFFDGSFYPYFLAQRSDEWDNGSVLACAYWPYNGSLNWTYWNEEESYNVDWEGMESSDDGDTIGMLLNLDEGSLTMYKNNRRLGVMKDGLSGTYCWYAEVSDGDEVSISKARLQATVNSTPN